MASNHNSGRRMALRNRVSFMDMDDYFLSRAVRDCENEEQRELAPKPLQDDLRRFAISYLVYKSLYTGHSWMQVVPMKSEGEFIRNLVSGWPRERAIEVYKHLYLKELLTLREEEMSAPASDYVDNMLFRKARISRKIDLRKPTQAEIIASFKIGALPTNSTHIFECECFSNPPEPLMDPSASMDSGEPPLADVIATIAIGEPALADFIAGITETPAA
jgi:hypothetical protein